MCVIIGWPKCRQMADNDGRKWNPYIVTTTIEWKLWKSHNFSEASQWIIDFIVVRAIGASWANYTNTVLFYDQANRYKFYDCVADAVRIGRKPISNSF